MMLETICRRITRTSITPVAACLMVLLCVPAGAAADPGPAEQAMEKKNPAIAKVSGDRVKLVERRLRKNLEDGRLIKAFRIMRRGESYQLLRVSELRGKRLTEAIPLVLGEDKSSLSVARPGIENLKWITTCSAGSCDGFCTPDGDHCDCYGASGGGLPDVGSIFDVEEEHAGDIESGVSGDCTFGTAGGGLYDVVIFR